MLCQKCNKNEATIHRVTVINGDKSEMHLCEECAREEGGIPSLAIQNILKGFLEKSQPLEQQLRCPHCSMTLDKFKSDGFLGCAQCYLVFEKYLEPVLHSIHGTAVHDGKKPKENAVKAKLVKPEIKPSKIELLKSELKKSVQEENYERAAQIRDEIRALQEGVR
ncbi:MAG: UvrB/UvrC motif-containing protein [Christensenellales bacterium]